VLTNLFVYYLFWWANSHINSADSSTKKVDRIVAGEKKTNSEVETDILNKIKGVYPVYINGRNNNNNKLIKLLNTNPRLDNKKKELSKYPDKKYSKELYRFAWYLSNLKKSKDIN
jgi:hypothetical protein